MSDIIFDIKLLIKKCLKASRKVGDAHTNAQTKREKSARGSCFYRRDQIIQLC
jgi:hypothetical protein